jgi:hypothetical protein
MNLFKGPMKKQIVYLLVICFSLSLLVFGFHHHEEGEIDDAICHVSLLASPSPGQAVLSAIGGVDTSPTSFYSSSSLNFIPQDRIQITTPGYTVLLIFLENESIFTSLSQHSFKNRAPPAL